MVLVQLQILPGDTVTRRFKQGARGTATVRDLDAQQINFLVNRSDNLQPAKLEQNDKITDGEEFAISFSFSFSLSHLVPETDLFRRHPASLS